MAETVTCTVPVTAKVLMGNVADEDPAAIVTLLCSVATEVLLLLSATVPPSVLFSAIVPVTELPPAIAAGLTATVNAGPPGDCKSYMPVLQLPAYTVVGLVKAIAIVCMLLSGNPFLKAAHVLPPSLLRYRLSP